MQIELMTQVNDEVSEAFERLIPQLTRYAALPTRSELLELAVSDFSFVFLARSQEENKKIIGSATLSTYLTPTGLHGWIEDVVVDKDYRRKGIGKALMDACLYQAKKLGLKEVSLTSRSSRCAANQLYQAMGFVKRETNVYRYPINPD